MCKVKIFERELRLLNRSEKTIQSYSKQFKLFLNYFKDDDIRYLSEDKIKDYILLLHSIYGYSAIVHATSSIKFWYLKLNGRKRKLNLPLPKKPKTLPIILSIDEVMKMIKLTINLKHRAILETVFCHGLRRSELINLKITDIDSSNMLLIIKQSKGLKDRDIPLSSDCLETLRLYFNAFRPKLYLFNGENNLQYSESSLDRVVKNAAKRANINKKVSPHSLRHAFASYLVSQNISLIKIKDWMGHSSVKSTEIYTHINKEENPIRLSA